MKKNQTIKMNREITIKKAKIQLAKREHHQYKRLSIFINNKRVLEKGLFCHKGIYRYITNKT